MRTTALCHTWMITTSRWDGPSKTIPYDATRPRSSLGHCADARVALAVTVGRSRLACEVDRTPGASRLGRH